MIPGNTTPEFFGAASAAAGGGAYSISRSLRFNSADSAYLSRTPASAGNRKTWTWAGWVKRGKLQLAPFFGATSAAGFFNADPQTVFSFYLDQLWAYYYDGSNAIYDKRTTAVFRDPSAWYHIVITQDTDNATAEDRIRLYVNGVRITTFVTSTNPSSGAQSNINQAIPHYISCPASYFDGYMADVHMVDGQALDPTSFGEFDATTGVWNPIEYTGSYGTNGFHLDFADNASTTTIGYDAAGSNDWTANNLSVTAGSGNDSLVDVPTNGAQTDTGVGGEVRGNYCTLNAVAKGLDCTLSNGNLDYTYGASSTRTGTPATIGMNASKWYWEIVCTATDGSLYAINGISNTQENSSVTSGIGYFPGATAQGWGYYSDDGEIRNNGSALITVSSYGINDVIGFAFDADAGKLWVSKNGTWQNSGNPAAGTGAVVSSLPSATYYPCVGDGSGGVTYSASVNFGQRPFAYTAPSGFKALCTANLTTPLVVKPNTVMDVVLYTGTGSALTPTSTLGFNPDLVWIKSRSAATDHAWYDAVRGAEKRVESNTADAQVTSDGGVTAFNSAGFSVGTLAQVNTNNDTYVAWTWDAGSSAAASNNDGSITSTVKANSSAGFSVVTGTVPATNTFTIGHGLGAEPHFIIVKVTNQSAYNWDVYHKTLGNTGRLRLNQTNASSTEANVWGSTTPTSSVFTMGGNGTWYFNGDIFVAYCFAPVAGYSAFGSYTGNGSADGPFVYTGQRSRWILLKNASSAGSNWYLFDTARDTYNVAVTYLLPNSSAAESTATFIDICSNGFKVRNAGGDTNGSGNTIVYACFAESPFQYARAR